MAEDLKELALNILADAKELPDPESPAYEISRDYMDKLMRAAGFDGIEGAERAIDPAGWEADHRGTRAGSQQPLLTEL